MTSINNVLEIMNISKKYRGVDFFSLDNINMTFTSGIYGILGANGAGKSTLFNIISGILNASSGKIIYNNKEITLNNIEEFKENIGYMPQNQMLYPNYSIKRFLYYIASLKGIEKKKIDSEVERVLNITELFNLKDRIISSLSGGMKQRLLISQALLSNPDILILDEPTAGLDPKQRIIIRNFLSKISKDKIVLISTHVVSDIEHISKEIVIIKKGKLVLKDRPENILKKFENIACETDIDSVDSAYFLENYNVSQMQIKSNGRNYIKLCGDFSSPIKYKNYEFSKADVDLEDVYLYLFEGGKLWLEILERNIIN